MKKNLLSKPAAGLVILLMLLSGVMTDALACTGLAVKNTDGTVVHGRTVEFGVPVSAASVFIPRNYGFTGSVPGEGKGMSYTSKYACLGSVSYGVPVIMDGMNEKGLSVGSFYFPTCAGYARLTAANRKIALSPVDFTNWILTQFATLDEVRAAVEGGKVAIVPTPVTGWGPDAPPLHYIVYDKAGKSIVIEPIGGKLIVYDNPFGVITNSPAFDWQLTNLRNYVNLNPLNVPFVAMQGHDLYAFGQGSGMHGLPGDFTPPSRFVRAVFIAVNARPAPDAEQGIFNVFHFLNNFDIPLGIACSADDKGILYCDRTQFTVARDPNNLRYYLRTFDDQTIRVVDMKKFNFDSKEILWLDVTGFKQSALDVSADLKAKK